MSLTKKLQRWRRMLQFSRDFRNFRSQLADDRGLPLRWHDRWMCLEDATAQTTFDHHYVLHTAWAAREVARLSPAVHHDISSSLYFVALVSAFVSVRFYDYRPAPLGLSNLSCGSADLMNLPFATDSLATISCMHVVEHVGLGRYGDPLDTNGDLKALRELERVVAVGGSLLVVVPVGSPRIQFNAHRIYSPAQVCSGLPRMRLAGFALIGDRPEDGIVHGLEHLTEAQKFHYGCGCFHFVKESPSPA